MEALAKEVDFCLSSMEKHTIEKGIVLRSPTKVEAKEELEKNCTYGKIQPRYLGLAKGSCHDLCKYGHKQEHEDDRKLSIFRRFMTNGNNPDAMKNHVRGQNIGDMMKSSGLRLKASTKSEFERTAASGNPSGVELKAPSLENNRLKIAGHAILQGSSKDKVNLIKALNSSKKKKMNQVLMKQKDAPVSEPSPVKRYVLKPKISPAFAKISSGSDSNIFRDKVVSYMKETIASSAMRQSSKKHLYASTRFQSKKKSASDDFTKSAIYLKSGFPKNLEKNPNFSTKLAHNAVNMKARKFGNLVNTKKGLEPNNCVGIHEIVRVKSENKDMNANNDSLCTTDVGYTSESSASVVTDSDFVDLKWKHNHKRLEKGGRRRIRTQSAQIDANSPLSYKMKFKRGKVIELHPTETVGPRRLRFRKGRVVHENSNGEGLKRIVRKREVGDANTPGAEGHANSSEALSIRLKHQGSQEKKDVQSLFNKVIEETASKLVEVRKSKVKALVGAFETVILLQESKAAHVA